MSYNPTWDDDSANYNAHTPRSFQKIENEAAKLWTDTTRDPNSINEVSANRSLGTTYTNGSNPRMVVVTVSLPASGGALSSGTSAVEVTLGGSYTPGGASSFAAILGQNNAVYTVPFLVQANEDYMVQATSSSDAPSIVYWTEFDFDAAYTAQNWSLGDTITTPKLNTYADGINNSLRPDLTLGEYNPTRTLASQTTTTENLWTFLTIRVETQDDRATLDLDGTDYSAHNNINVNTIGAVYAMVPSGVQYRLTRSGSTATIQDTRERAFASPTNTVFQSADSKTQVGQKLRDLDASGATGKLHSNLSATRTDAGTGTGSRTPSSSNVSFVTAYVDLQTNNNDPTTADLLVDGISVDRVHVASGNVDTSVMLASMLSPGSSWSISIGSNAAVNQRTEWVIS